MSDSPKKPTVSIGGINFGSTKEVPPVQAEKIQPKPDVDLYEEKEVPKLGGWLQQPSLEESSSTPKPKIKAAGHCSLVHDSVKLKSGSQLCYAGFTDDHRDPPFIYAYSLMKFGIPIESISFGQNDSSVVHVPGSYAVTHALEDEFQKYYSAAKVPIYSRVMERGALFLRYDKNYWSTMGAPNSATDWMNKMHQAGKPILDLAVDSQENYVVVSSEQTAWQGIPADLIERINMYSQRGDPVQGIPHLEGNSWFIQTAKSWYSANLPQQLYTRLKKATKVHALAISKTGRWLVQYEEKAN